MINKSQSTGKTPLELGYHMPAEWEKHDSVWLAWPYDPTTFPDRVEKAEEAYLQIVKAIHETEYVNMFIKNNRMKNRVTNLFNQNGIKLERIHFFKFNYADVWFRDYGPIFVINRNKELAMVHWIFNSWGRKYSELLKDRQIPQIINRKMCLRRFEPGIVLEGGSIDVNGKGTLLTTEQCLLNKNRNPHLSKMEIEKILKDNLGVSHFIWLREGIIGDDTDGHIDDIARFVDPTTIICACEKNANDENHAILKENYELLLKSVEQDGNKLKIVKIPMPFVVSENEERLPASYTNFYIGNGVVLVPIFKHKNDKEALSIMQKLFPSRKVVGINCADLVYGFGTLHCISQQQPSTS
jgi:agmatine deiminase